MDMIERVARVLHARDDYDGYTWHDYIPDARAAIAAMREPTDEMLDSVTPEGIPAPRTYQHECKAFWYRLIDAALGEGS